MYPATSQMRTLFAAGNRQVLDITFVGANESLHLTDSNIIQGSVSLNRQSASGSTIEIGSAISSEFTMKLDNGLGAYNDVDFAGARMYVRVGVKDWSDEESDFLYVPLGYFTVDNAPRKTKSISISALDDMVLFDKTVDMSQISLPITASSLVSRLCSICNVRLRTNVAALPNGTYTISQIGGDPKTYRQILMWVAELTGTCAYIDYDGYLCMEWYADTSLDIDETTRFSSDLSEGSITITGVKYKQGNAEALAGAEGYILVSDGNGLISAEDLQTVADAVYAEIGQFTYYPFTAEVVSMPYLFPLDMFDLIKGEDSYPCALMSMTFAPNKNTQLQGVGTTTVQQGYASLNPMTAQEAAILNSLINSHGAAINDRVQTVFAFNELISNALGLHVTPVEQSDGSVIYYLHDQALLSESMVIFTMTAEGIAWTNTGWNDGSPVWSSGVTAAGDALFRLLSAEGISVSKPGEDYHIEVTPSTFAIYYRNMVVTSISADEMSIPKAVFSGYAQCGRIRFVPYSTTGTNLVFTD